MVSSVRPLLDVFSVGKKSGINYIERMKQREKEKNDVKGGKELELKLEERHVK